MQSCFHILPRLLIYHRVWLIVTCSYHMQWQESIIIGKHWSAETLVRKQKCRNNKRCHTDSQLCMLKPCSQGVIIFWWCESHILVFLYPACVINTDKLVLCARYPRLRLCMMPQWTNILVLVNKSLMLSVRCTMAVNNVLSDWMSIACCGVTVI